LLVRWDYVSKIRDYEVGLRFVDDFNRLVGNLTGGEVIGLMNEAFDLGVILFDAAGSDAYNSSRL
jgi:hypothetical protein